MQSFVRDPWKEEETIAVFRRYFPKIATDDDIHKYLGFGELYIRNASGCVHVFDMFDRSILNVRTDRGFEEYKNVSPINSSRAWNQNFLRRLYKLITMHGLSQADLSEVCAIPQSSLSKILQGKMEFGQVDLGRIIFALKLSEKELKYLFCNV
mgnify:CR=1 FL=1